MKTLFSVLGNSQKLDGGAMFGNVPKALWTRWIDCDEHNRINLACRTLLIQEENRTILFETGIGTFFPPKLKQRFGVVEEEHMLCTNLAALGYTPQDIDIVVLSHLHFDHAGGLLSPYSENKDPEILFSNAHFVVSQGAFARASAPHYRDRASFIPQLPNLLRESGRLVLVNEEKHPLLGDDYLFHYSEGHTPGLLCTEIQTSRGAVLFGADLIPGAPWVHLPITMGYDRFPEKLIDEKRSILSSLIQKTGHIFFTHDHNIALAEIYIDEKGRFSTRNAQETVNCWKA